MRVHTKATDRRSVRLPSTTVALASPPSRRQRRAGQPRPATPQGRQCDGCSHQSHPQPRRGRRSERLAQATPPFGLTLRAMNVGKRHRRAPQWAHLSLLMSVIALALACFPALAQAECTSSSCVQYTESIPKPEGGNTPSGHQKPPAKVSKIGEGNGSQPSQPDGSNGTKEAGGSEGNEPSGKGGAVGGGGGTGQGKPGGSAHAGGKKAVNPGAQIKPGVQASKSSDGGGSSPLVPILIVIAVLAAISVAAVMIRQRRQRRGPTATASPEAN